MNPLLLLAFLLCLLPCFSSKDTITFDESLVDGQVRVSSGEKFSLGFFSPGVSSNRYLGIWFTQVSIQTVVWVANRDNPINDTSGVLSFDRSGRNLVLWCCSGTNTTTSTTLWFAGGKSMARLLDTGNLVILLQQEPTKASDANNLVGKEVWWQSFDHPTDTVLASMKLGLDRETGINRIIRSWKSPDDPATGDTSYYLDPNGSPQLMLYKGQTKKWRSGMWNGIRWSGVAYMSRGFTSIFNTSVVNDDNESTVVWGVTDPTIIFRIYTHPSGNVRRATWNGQRGEWFESFYMPKDPCDYYGQCGPNGNCDPNRDAGEFVCSCIPGFEPKILADWSMNDGSSGCVRKRSRNSSCGRDGEGFVKLENAKVPDSMTGRLNKGMYLDMCRQECLKNCSCTAYASSDLASGIGCVTLYGDLLDTRVFADGGQDLYVRVDAIELDEYMKSLRGHTDTRKRKMLAIVLVSVTAAIILILSLVYFLLRTKRKGNNGGSNSISQVTIFSINDIFIATANFSLDNKLGQGGFGSVYKGRLLDGREIAVKRLSRTSRQGTEEFKNEVQLVSKLQHNNLARLFGCCIHGEEKMLVYEYLPNKSLDFFIFDKIEGTGLDWKTRFNIIIGTARGLLYLHQDSRLKIIHRDLKASNVLLDATMNPKISDFGMARMFEHDQMEANTNRVVGTYGYMAPEYAMEGMYSMKSDVYSFGVMTLEIVSGRRSNHYNQESSSLGLIDLSWDMWKEGKALDVMDSSTIASESYFKDQVMRCIQIGLLCIQESPKDRPTMSNVVFMLVNATSVLPSPKKPAFISKRKFVDPDSAAAAAGPTVPSINNVSITDLEAR
ncbi:unnamed protein product [Linum tenue]|uniref:Receptor-like serine/threonine-protein kinase n=1 Tax=Linum tenue TaxID=586396 RepID=A0AAV0PAG4_9ROSI|nr:unnamed protein product [Linum tenue]